MQRQKPDCVHILSCTKVQGRMEVYFKARGNVFLLRPDLYRKLCCIFIFTSSDKHGTFKVKNSLPFSRQLQWEYLFISDYFHIYYVLYRLSTFSIYYCTCQFHYIFSQYLRHFIVCFAQNSTGLHCCDTDLWLSQSDLDCSIQLRTR